MNLTKISDSKPPTKNPQNHETEMKTRLPNARPTSLQQNRKRLQRSQQYVRQKGRLRPKPLFKVFSSQRKNIYFLKTKHLFLT